MPDENGLLTAEEPEISSETDIQPPEVETDEPAGAETPELDVETPESGSPEPSQPQNSDAQAKEISKFLRELRQGDETKAPVARALQDSYFRSREFQKLFESVDTARNFKAQVESVGGLDGIAEMQDIADGAKEMDRMFDDGDPRIIDQMSRESPEGFKRLVPHAIERLRAVDRDAYDALLQPHIGKFITASGIVPAMNEMAECLEAGDTVAAVRAYNRMLPWFQQALGSSRSLPDTADGNAGARGAQPAPTATPVADDGFMRSAADEILPHMERTVEAGMKTFLAGRKLGPEAIADLKNGILAEIGKVTDADEVFQKAMANMARRGDRGRYVSFAKETIDRVRHNAIKAVFERRYGTAQPGASRTATRPAPAAQRQQTPAQSANSPLMLPKQPPMAQINVNADPGGALFMRGRAFLKDGRFVQWKK